MVRKGEVGSGAVWLDEAVLVRWVGSWCATVRNGSVRFGSCGGVCSVGFRFIGSGWAKVRLGSYGEVWRVNVGRGMAWQIRYAVGGQEGLGTARFGGVGYGRRGGLGGVLVR